MINQLLQNRGFENELESYITQGSVSANSDIAYSGQKSALLLATPMEIAEMSQVVFFYFPGAPFRFSFFAKRFLNDEVKNVSNIQAEVNFLSAVGTVIPPGIVISIRGRDISEDTWHRYDGYAYAPSGALAAQVVIRLEPPESGTSGLLVDDLELVNDLITHALPPAPISQGQHGIPPAQTPPAQQGIPTFPGLPMQILLNTLANLLLPGSPYANMTPQAPASPLQPLQNLMNTMASLMFPGSPYANMTPQAPVSPLQPLQNLMNTVASLMFPGSPYANMTPTVPASPVHQGIPTFPGFTHAPPIALAPQAQSGIPAFPGSSYASPPYPGSPLSNMMFPGSPYTNMTPVAQGMPR